MKDETVYFRPEPAEKPFDILAFGRGYFAPPVDDDERRKPSDILVELAKRGVRFDPHTTR